MAAGGKNEKSRFEGKKLKGGKTKEGKLHKKNGEKGLKIASFWVINSKNFRQNIYPCLQGADPLPRQ